MLGAPHKPDVGSPFVCGSDSVKGTPKQTHTYIHAHYKPCGSDQPGGGALLRFQGHSRCYSARSLTPEPVLVFDNIFSFQNKQTYWESSFRDGSRHHHQGAAVRYTCSCKGEITWYKWFAGHLESSCRPEDRAALHVTNDSTGAYEICKVQQDILVKSKHIGVPVVAQW